ncbi:hypothetical protein R1flu_018425 [Riccia fluitans]|uniref:Legumain prodomain domain-containing protein n=1 Tax=Riccia fluitans TaxID=41844 RepID=A0ABD1ZFS9_9MARC
METSGNSNAAATIWMVTVSLLLASVAAVRTYEKSFEDQARIEMPTERVEDASNPSEEAEKGTRWAVLIAGSRGYGNYRHQADICHAYQILRKNGVAEENIVVFMYDDIADNYENPRPGQIINSPMGSDVYHGVPKDYTGMDVNVNNLFAAILGDKSAITGGSGKVVDSGPDDHIFIYYSDHGGPGVLGMPTPPYLYAPDLISTLQRKYDLGTYKKMVIYLEACESGSIFEGILPEGLNIYVTTASNAEESSWGFYCPGMIPSPPEEFDTCLGDLYSVAWMEDSEVQNLKKETLKDQYEIVKKRTSNHDTYNTGSHVMEYGDVENHIDHLALYLGYDPSNENVSFPVVPDNNQNAVLSSVGVQQRDADMLHLWHKFSRAVEGSPRKMEAEKELLDTMAVRMHIDESMKMIGEVLFGAERGSAILEHVVATGQALVDDWDCLKGMVRSFESKCGFLTQYGMKHTRAFANMCNAGVGLTRVSEAAAEVCVTTSGVWQPLSSGFSA